MFGCFGAVVWELKCCVGSSCVGRESVEERAEGGVFVLGGEREKGVGRQRGRNLNRRW